MIKIAKAGLIAVCLALCAFAQSKPFYSDVKLSGVQGKHCGPAAADACGGGDGAGDNLVVSGRSEDFSIVLTVELKTGAEKNSTGGGQGKWTMAVSRAGRYIGTLYGDVTGGRARWVQNVLTGERAGRAALASLRILGGTGGYNEVEANDVPTLSFTSFTGAALPYTEARLTSEKQDDL